MHTMFARIARFRIRELDSINLAGSILLKMRTTHIRNLCMHICILIYFTNLFHENHNKNLQALGFHSIFLKTA